MKVPHINSIVKISFINRHLFVLLFYYWLHFTDSKLIVLQIDSKLQDVREFNQQTPKEKNIMTFNSLMV
jgi:hypothetical protein